MSLTVKLKADPFYDGVDRLKSVLFQARVDVSSKGFKIEEVSDGIYKINLPNPPKNYQEILKQFGKIIE